MILDATVCYNLDMEFSPSRFQAFIQDEFVIYRGPSLRSLNDFARSIPVSSQVISNWWNGKLKERPSPAMCDVLIKKFGLKAYEALGLPVPGISPENSEVFFSGLKELARELKSSNIDPDSKEFVDLVREIFSKYDVIVEEENNNE